MLRKQWYLRVKCNEWNVLRDSFCSAFVSSLSFISCLRSTLVPLPSLCRNKLYFTYTLLIVKGLYFSSVLQTSPQPLRSHIQSFGTQGVRITFQIPPQNFYLRWWVSLLTIYARLMGPIIALIKPVKKFPLWSILIKVLNIICETL